jgi:hypothetical protein
VLVFHHYEKPRIVTEKFNASTQCRLGIDRQTIGIEKDDGFERNPATPLDVRLGEKFEFITDEFDTLAMCAIDKHDVGLQFLLITTVDLVHEIVDQGAFSCAGGTMK